MVLLDIFLCLFYYYNGNVWHWQDIIFVGLDAIYHQSGRGSKLTKARDVITNIVC